MQENDVALEDDLKDKGLNHLFQQESTNQIVNMILQDQHYRLLEESITKGNDYANWLQWATIEKSKNLKGCYINEHVLNPVHLNHESMQQGVPSKDERWDEIRRKIKFDQASGENQSKGLWTLLENFKDVFVWHKRE
jgi:hypothetical protein